MTAPSPPAGRGSFAQGAGAGMLAHDSDASDAGSESEQEADSATGEAEAASHSTRRTPCDSVSLDPRLLAQEFSISSLLRSRQVDIIRDLAASAQGGHSTVQSMLFGQGKTTVVTPTLAAMMGCGGRLVLNVTPHQLQDMSREALRARVLTPVIRRDKQAVTLSVGGLVGGCLSSGGARPMAGWGHSSFSAPLACPPMPLIANPAP